MRTLLAVDPGLSCSGVAVFDALDHSLQRAAPITALGRDRLQIPQRCLMMAAAIRAYGDTPDYLVCEWPQIYTSGKGKGDPNDLIPLAVICGMLAAQYPSASVYTYAPREWKGQVPKRVMVTRVLGRLSDEELALLTTSDHNAIDAIGIGLWHLGRL